MATTTTKKSSRSASATTRKRSTSTSTRRSRSSRSSSKNALTLLKNDHQEVERLFKTFEKLGERAAKRRRQTADKVIEALSKHAAIEEQVFYPEVRRSMRDVTDEILEALEEHHIVKWTLSELEDMEPGDERFGAKMTVLMESVRHHVKEEERELFPKVRKAFSRAELNELGSRLETAKAAAPSRPHPRTPDTPPGNVVAQAITAPMDAASKLRDVAARTVQDIMS